MSSGIRDSSTNLSSASAVPGFFLAAAIPVISLRFGTPYDFSAFFVWLQRVFTSSGGGLSRNVTSAQPVSRSSFQRRSAPARQQFSIRIRFSMDSSWAKKRTHSSQRLKALPSCRIANRLHNGAIWLGRPAALAAREVALNWSSSTPSAMSRADVRFPDPRAAVRFVSSPIQPTPLRAVAHRGNSYTHDQSAFAPPLSDWGLRYRIFYPA